MIADLEEEKRRCAQDSAQSEDFTFMLQTERDKLLQEVWLIYVKDVVSTWSAALSVCACIMRIKPLTH